MARRQLSRPLQAYLERLVASPALRRSEPLYYFLAAHRTPSRKRVWEQLAGGAVQRALSSSS